MDEVIGLEAHTLLFPESGEAFRRSLARVLASGEEVLLDTAMSDPQGAEAWYRTRMFQLDGAGGQPIVVLVARNITELKEAEASTEQLRKLLPVCSWCNRIQKDGGGWESIESYLSSHTGTLVTHGICPTCLDDMAEGKEDPEGSTSRKQGNGGAA